MKSVPSVLVWLWLAAVLALVSVICILVARLLRSGQRRRVLLALGYGLGSLILGLVVFLLIH